MQESKYGDFIDQKVDEKETKVGGYICSLNIRITSKIEFRIARSSLERSWVLENADID